MPDTTELALGIMLIGFSGMAFVWTILRHAGGR